MRNQVVIAAPTNLGLHPGGVEKLSEALIGAGFAERLRASVVSRVVPPPYDPVPDPETRIMNARAIAAYTRALADPVGRAIDVGQFPIVLGGDCSILLGNVMALRRRGRFGLLFVDGHNDCYEPGAYPTGEAAAMDLAQSGGVGPEFLTNIDGLRPYVRASDTVVFGTRDSCDGDLRGRMPTPAVRPQALVKWDGTAYSDPFEGLGNPNKIALAQAVCAATGIDWDRYDIREKVGALIELIREANPPVTPLRPAADALPST